LGVALERETRGRKKRIEGGKMGLIGEPPVHLISSK
jgi:hypothetical protein